VVSGMPICITSKQDLRTRILHRWQIQKTPMVVDNNSRSNESNGDSTDLRKIEVYQLSTILDDIKIENEENENDDDD